ncbi:GNAT family N-acetyltransferase [Myxococcota bacterium]|nr:GNAT family N-acetyltransferase [Myxococcota bacterium]
MRIAVLYNDDWKHYPPGAPSYEADAEVRETAEAVAQALARTGFEPVLMTVDDALEPLVEALGREKVDGVFNLVESLGGASSREPEIPELLDRLGLPYTGNAAHVLRAAHAKDETRKILAAHGVPVARGFVVSEPAEAAARLAASGARFPLFVKPARTDASIGIDQRSIVRAASELEAQLARVAAEVPGPILVEEYLPGREVNVAIFPEPEHGQAVCTWIDFSECVGVAPIVTYDCKWRPGTPEYAAKSLPAKGLVPEDEIARAQHVARAAFLALGGTSYGRVDLRMGEDGGFYVIDVNPNPDINPDAGLTVAARSVGLDHDALIRAVMEAALANGRTRPPAKVRDLRTGVTIRAIAAADRAPLAELLSKIENFTPDEQAVALELIDGSIQDPARSGYETIVAELDGDATGAPKIAGYLCYGLTPMTEWTYDLYWTAVDRTVRGKGLGKALLVRFEALVRERRGKIIRIETSSMESYGGTLEFYLRNGYAIVSQIRDFYRAGDDLITLVKTSLHDEH